MTRNAEIVAASQPALGAMRAEDGWVQVLTPAGWAKTMRIPEDMPPDEFLLLVSLPSWLTPEEVAAQIRMLREGRDHVS